MQYVLYVLPPTPQICQDPGIQTAKRYLLTLFFKLKDQHYQQVYLKPDHHVHQHVPDKGFCTKTKSASEAI